MTDLLGRPLGDDAGANLFTPDFGLQPHRIVGRDDVIGDIKDGLGAGPGDHRFTSVLIGHRGSGKTVLLNEIRSVAAQAGWIVLRTDASTPGLYERIDEEISSLTGPAADSVAPAGAAGETALTLHAGIASVSRRLARAATQERSVSKKLEVLGGHAAEHGSAVLLSVDELQAGPREELRRLSADLQHITKGDLLPVAFVGAGLPSIEFTIMRDSKMTFFQRCHDHSLAALTTQSVLAFFKQTIEDAGGRCSNANLRRMADAADGIPYKMQVIGDGAWVISGAPANEIDDASVELALAAAEERMQARVYSHVWEGLEPVDRDILRVVAASGGIISRRDLGAGLLYTASRIVRRLDRLTRMGCIVREPRSDVELGPLAPLPFVAGIVEEEQSVGAARSPAEPAAPPKPPGDRCAKPLKTIDAACILPHGHNGRCRSR